MDHKTGSTLPPKLDGDNPKPTVAVAIQGVCGSTESPAKVIAFGRGKLAEQILAIAFAKGVKVREDADLAELLSALDLETPIPPEAIMVVADILTKVYEANQALTPHEPTASDKP